MSDHKDSPYVDSHPMIDIGDYFLWPGTSGGPVFMMTLNPLTSPDPRVTSEIHLDAAATYEFKVDLDGDAVARFCVLVVMIHALSFPKVLHGAYPGVLF